MKIIKLLSLVIISIHCIFTVQAQISRQGDVHESSRGREFNVVIMYDAPLFNRIHITSFDHPCEVIVTTKVDNKATSYSIPAWETLTITPSISTTLQTIGVSSRIINIFADQDVSVGVYQSRSTKQDAYRALPVRTYGKEYVIGLYNSTTGNSRFSIVATEDNTAISIRTSATLTFNSQTASLTDPVNITLNKHEVFYYSAFTDFTGTQVSANKPIAVFGNNMCAALLEGQSTCNYLIAQYPSVERLGSIYVLIINNQRVADVYRVIGAYDNTVITATQLSLSTTINKGDYYEFTLTIPRATVLQCSERCLLMHYDRGVKSAGSPNQPSMNIVPAIDQFMTNYFMYIKRTSPLYTAYPFITIIIPTSYKDGIRLNNQPLSSHGVIWNERAAAGVTYAITSTTVSSSGNGYFIKHITPTVRFGLIEHSESTSRSLTSLSGGFQFPATYRSFITVVENPIAQIVHENQEFNLTCSAIGYPSLSVVWYKDNKLITANVQRTPYSGNSTLTVTSSSSSNAGSYYCQFCTSIGLLNSASAQIIVYTKPVVKSIIGNISPIAGHNLVLTCDYTSNNNATVTWLKDNIVIARDTYFNLTTLRIQNVSLADAANYTCSVENLIGTRNFTAIVTVRISPFIVQNPLNITIDSGDTFKLVCQIQGEPSPTISWLKDNKKLLDSSYSTEPSGLSTLLINKASISDSGSYKCRGQNSAGASTTMDAIVIVYYAPKILLNPSNTTIVEGDRIELQCTGTSLPIFSVTWLKNNQPTTSDFTTYTNASSTNRTATLVIFSANIGDDGFYQCKLTNRLGNIISMASRVEVQFAPRIITALTSSSQSVIENSAIILNCQANANPVPTFTWYKDGIEINRTTYLSISYNQSQILLTNVTEMDAGSYNCTSTNLIGSASSNMDITVYTKPFVIASPQSANIYVGTSISLNCSSDGYPQPNITWTRNGAVITSSNDQEILSLINVTTEQSGKYQCLFRNAAGNISSNVATIIVYTTLVVTSPNTIVDAPIGQKFSLICSCSGIPLATTATWKRNGTVLNNLNYSISINKIASSSVMTTLTIDASTHEDAGNYSCAMSNNYTSSNAELISLTILEPPWSVQSVQISNIMPRSLTISWDLPIFTGNTPLTNYSVTITNVDNRTIAINCSSSIVTNACVVPPTITSVNFSGLKPNTFYYILVWASNAVGNSGIISTSSTTNETNPEDTVNNLYALGYNSTTIRIKWTPPKLPNGQINYRLYQWKATYPYNVTDIKSAVLYDGGSTSFDSTNLEENQVYFYQVIPYNIKYGLIGPMGMIINGTTHEDVPSAPPTNISVISTTPWSISVTWLPPPLSHRNGVIMNYNISYYSTKWRHGGSTQVSDGKTVSVLGGLIPYTAYNITIKAATIIGYGPSSDDIISVTEQTVPSASPVNVSATTVSAWSIVVTWLPLPISYQHGVIINYHISYYSSEWQHGNTIQTTGSATSLVLNRLIPYTDYNVTVKAATIIGFGPESNGIVTRTFQAAPGAPPANISTTSISAWSISVDWLPPPLIDQNGIIINYNVTYYSSKWKDTGTIQVDNNNTSLVLDGLRPYTDYNVTIKAATVIGFGPDSMGIITRTLQTFPTAPPSNVSTIPISGRLISVAWLPPPISDQNGVIVNYNISYYSNEWKHGDTIQVSGNTTSLLLEELIPHTNYSITVKAATIIGFGPASIGIVTRTPQIVPSSPPVNVNATAISAWSISVTWLPLPISNQHGVIINYNISYYSNKWQQGSTIQTSGNITTLVLVGLIPYTDYNITVKAANIIGFGPDSIGILTRTFQAVPGAPPSNISAMSLTASSISVSWLPPPLLDQNGIIINYSISYYSNIRMHGSTIQVSGNTSSQILRRLFPYTYYNITIKAATTVGFGSSSTNILTNTLQTVPSAAPANVRATIISARSISVTWLPPPKSDQNGVITNYNIAYYSSKWSHGGEIQVSGNITMLVIDKLIAYSDYNVTVKASTIIGFGPKSIGIITRTLQAVPSSPPTNVSIIPISARSISVSWQPPPISDQNGIITNYSISYYSTKWSHGGEMQVSSETASFVIRQLIPYTDYNITVKASTIIGFGPYSMGILTRTLQAVPSAPPTNVSIIPISARSISVSWLPPPISDQNGIITNYSISYYSSQRSHGGEIQVSGNITLLVIRQLIPYTDYNITVKASTIIGFGPYSIDILTRTLQAVPSAPPTNVGAIAISAESISVSWLPPPIFDQNGIITSYNISCYSSKWSHGSEMQVSGNTTSLVVHKLIPYTDYNITVKASTIIGFGPGSIGTLTKTFQAAPASPVIQNVSLINNNNTVRVGWQLIPERQRNGIVLGYYIVFRNTKFGFFDNRTIYVNQTTTNVNTRYYSAANLKYYSTYLIFLYAFTAAGTSPESLQKSIETLESVPSASPINVMTTSGTLAATSIVISWSPPLLVNQNGIITKYKVSYSLQNKNSLSNSTIITLGNVNQHSIYNLLPSTNYSILVAAATSVGFGPYNSPVTHLTYPAVAPNVTQQPRNRTVAAGTDITLECRATGDPVPTVQWLSNGQLVSSIYSVVTKAGYGSLFIKNSNTADNGTYQCQFTNSKGSVMSNSAYIYVNDGNITGFCLGEITSDMKWSKTYNGYTAIAKCPVSAKGNATRSCKLNTNGNSVWDDIDTTNCETPSFDVLSVLTQQLNTVGTNFSETIIDGLVRTTTGRKLYGGDIVISASILSKLNEVMPSVSESELNKLVTIQSNLFNTQNKEGWKFSQKFCRSSSNNQSILTNLEEFANKATILSATNKTTVNANNLAVAIYDLDGVSASSDFHVTDGTNMATGIRISLPKATIQNNQLIKAVVITYKTLKEMIPSSSANSSNINPAGSTIQINSQIISISFYPDRYGNLSHPVRIIFQNTNTIENKNTAKENVCAFWASAPSQCGWDSTGCRTGSESNSTHTVCYCSHTTTFSVITRDKLVQSLQIEVITYICCGIAIAVLALTIAIFVMHWKDVKSIVNVMNINIFLCLLMINILVISGLTAIYWKPLCVAISIFLHYIFLAAYSWLLRCAICMHYLFAKNKLAPGSIMGNFLTCCILPAIIPILVGIIQVSRYGFDGYLSHYACWLSTTPPVVVTFIIPMILLALAALIYNVLTTTRASSNARVVYDYNDEELEINRKHFRQSFVVLVTFIMTSILFVAFISTKDIVCQYIFAIISLIQSIYILLFYALKNKEIQMDCKSKAKNHTAYELKPTKGKSSSHLTPANYNNYEDVGEDAIYQEVD